MNTIRLPGLHAENLLAFLAALGTLRVLSGHREGLKLHWSQFGTGWEAVLSVPDDYPHRTAQDVANEIDRVLRSMPSPHPILEWERFLSNEFEDQRDYYCRSALDWIERTEKSDFTAVFSSQLPEVNAAGNAEYFDHPFRAARKDYYIGNLKSVIENTQLVHLLRALARSWDYADAMANQSLRLDHLDDRRHAYQWHAPTEDPNRHKSGCMLGANRLAIEAFNLFPCVPQSKGGSTVGFVLKSKTYTWVRWPVWTTACNIDVISSILNLPMFDSDGAIDSAVVEMGISAVFQSRRVPVEKNKVFLPPVAK